MIERLRCQPKLLFHRRDKAFPTLGLDLAFSQKQLVWNTENLEARKAQPEKEAWEAGLNLDDIDRIL